MNLWVRPAGLFVGLALFALTGCQESGEIGLDLDPERFKFVVRYAEFPLRTSVIQIDSIFSRNSSMLVTGHTRHPDFGEVTATGFARLFLNDTSFKRDSAAVFDSLVLQLRVRYLYGDNYQQDQQFYVHELSEIIPDTAHFTKSSTEYFPETLAEPLLNFSRFDTSSVDTLVRIHLSAELGNRILQASLDTGSQVLKDQDAFQDFFKGLALRSDPLASVVMGTEMIYPNTRLTLYYHSSRDTMEYSFRFNASKDLFDITNYYHNITPDRTGTPLQGIPGFYQEFDPGDGRRYLQAGTGLLTRISLTPVFSFRDTVENLVVNRAELYVRAIENTPHFDYPIGMELYITDASNNFLVSGGTFRAVRDEEGSGNLILRPVYNTSTQSTTYTGNISLFTQGVIEGSNKDTLLLLTPTNLAFYLNQLAAEQADIRLRIFYSTLN